MWVVREGYEGLVLGNTEDKPPHVQDTPQIAEGVDVTLVENLRFGDGELLKNGMGDWSNSKGRSLKGRYIVRVGWDDVRAWFSEVGLKVIFVLDLC